MGTLKSGLYLKQRHLPSIISLFFEHIKTLLPPLMQLSQYSHNGGILFPKSFLNIKSVLMRQYPLVLYHFSIYNVKQKSKNGVIAVNFKSDVMRLNRSSETPYLTYKLFDNISFINHAFSTRLGGVSGGEFESMNLSFGRGDSDENVTENYRRLCSSAGFEFDSLTASAQDHHTFVRCVTKNDCGVGIFRPKDILSVDALVTNEPGVTLVTYYADCTPLFFVDVKRHVIALAHAGWRGTVGRIGAEVIKTMSNKYGSKAEDIKCAIGPAISKCCYEVDEDCCKNFKAMTDLDRSRFIFPKENGKYMLDLLETNRQIVMNVGVLEKNITISDICTCCNSELLWSHRATKGKRGGMAAFMCLKTE